MTDTYGQYLNESSRHPLLTHEEEIALGRQVRAWLDDPDPSKATIAAGQWAKDKMMRANLRLVTAVAKKYFNRGLEPLDLVQEGAIGLARAVDKFDPTKGYRFSTYAYTWIRQAMIRALHNDSRTIRLPIHVSEAVAMGLSWAEDYRKETGKVPSHRQLTQHLMDRGKLTKTLGVEKCEKQLAHYLTIAQRPRSLNFSRDDGNDATSEIGELIPCELPGPETIALDSEAQTIAAGLLSHLSHRHRLAVEMYFGLNGFSPTSFTLIGEALGVNKETARNYYKRGIEKLRARADQGLVEMLEA